MNRGAVFFILMLAILYTSFVAGKIIAELDEPEFEISHGNETIRYAEYDPAAVNSVSSYLNPFSETEYSDVTLSESENGTSVPDVSNYYSSSGVHSTEGFASRSERKTSLPALATSSAGSDRYRSSRRSNPDHESFNLGGNPFGGLVSQLVRIEEQQSSTASINSTGTFGMKLGYTETSSTDGFQDKTLGAPLDSGVYFLLIVSLAAGIYFIRKKTAFAGA